MSDETAADGEASSLGRGFMLWQITNGWQRSVRAALASSGLTYVQVVLLAGLQARIAAGDKVSQAGLAQSLGADVMMTSQVLRTLEAGGLVRRDRDPQDTRARTLALTSTGAAKLEAAKPLLDQVDDAFFDVLGRKEDRFIKSLRKLWRKRRLVGMSGNGADAEAPAPKPAAKSKPAARAKPKKAEKPEKPAVKRTAKTKVAAAGE
ncbi:MAG TPA: MarR family winged helix-turn-helix transcriptional regulator [Aliidongia sp.]|nr:MarR family winged helix-turn-helix transcriptional regulator [Aliidongia sp.]